MSHGMYKQNIAFGSVFKILFKGYSVVDFPTQRKYIVFIPGQSTATNTKRCSILLVL